MARPGRESGDSMIECGEKMAALVALWKSKINPALAKAQRREGKAKRKKLDTKSTKKARRTRRKAKPYLGWSCRSHTLPFFSASPRLCASMLLFLLSFAPLRLRESWVAFDFDFDLGLGGLSAASR